MARRSPRCTAAEVALLVENDYLGHIDRPVEMYELDEELFDEGRQPGEAPCSISREGRCRKMTTCMVSSLYAQCSFRSYEGSKYYTHYGQCVKCAVPSSQGFVVIM